MLYPTGMNLSDCNCDIDTADGWCGICEGCREHCLETRLCLESAYFDTFGG
jgi:hypothetical protein